MTERPKNPLADVVNQAREQLGAEFQAQAERIQQLEQSVQELRNRHQQLETSVQDQLEKLAKAEIPAPPEPPAPAASPMLDQVLAAVRNLITATLPEQVLEVLTEEGQNLGVRAAVFDVRGKAAWGAAARGFAGLTDKVFRGVVVQLSQDTPFRTCFETAGHVDTDARGLKRNRNILDKLQPGPQDTILLLPVRSAGSVSAIFYADTGGKGQALPVDALKILAEFAGAQLDRLMAFSGGLAAPAEAAAPAPEVTAEPVAEEAVAVVEAQPVEVEAIEVETPKVSEPEIAPAPSEAPEEAAPVLGETVPVPVQEAPPQPAAAPAAAAVFDLAQLSDEDQKNHRDAKRFSKLLVSEIELYSKAKVQDGRRSGDLYKRLKSDIDRSRRTYEKRFGKTVGRQVDYFHEELVRVLAGSDAKLLGSDYPGPSV